MRQRDQTKVVDVHVLAKWLQIELAPVVEFKGELNSCVEEKAVHVGVQVDDSGLSAGPYGCMHYLLSCKLRDTLLHRNVKRNCAGHLLSMFPNKLVQAVLATTNSCDLDPGLDQTIGHGTTYARGGSNEQDMLIRERHLSVSGTRPEVEGNRVRAR